MPYSKILDGLLADCTVGDKVSLSYPSMHTVKMTSVPLSANRIGWKKNRH